MKNSKTIMIVLGLVAGYGLYEMYVNSGRKKDLEDKIKASTTGSVSNDDLKKIFSIA